MIKTIKKYLLNRKLKHVRNGHRCVTSFMDMGKVKNVLLVFEGTNVSRLGRVNKIIDDFEKDGIKTTALSYYDAKELADICLVQNKIDFVCRGDFTSIGFPMPQVISQHFTQSYDLVLVLDMEYCSYTDVFVQMVDATFKAGKAGVLKEDALDLVIELEDDRDETFLVDQIKYYLRSVKSGA